VLPRLRQGVQQHKAKGMQAPGARAPSGGGAAAAGAPKPAPVKPGAAPPRPAGEQRLDPLGRPTEIDPEHQVRSAPAGERLSDCRTSGDSLSQRVARQQCPGSMTLPSTPAPTRHAPRRPSRTPTGRDRQGASAYEPRRAALTGGRARAGAAGGGRAQRLPGAALAAHGARAAATARLPAARRARGGCRGGARARRRRRRRAGARCGARRRRQGAAAAAARAVGRARRGAAPGAAVHTGGGQRARARARPARCGWTACPPCCAYWPGQDGAQC